MSLAFTADAELVMDVRTDAISFPSAVQGLGGIADALVSRFAQQYENVYTFCLGTPPDDAATFHCDWLVCMTEKQSGTARVGVGTYEWRSREASGMVSNLKITIEEMHTLQPAHADSILEWASALPYPWCPRDLALHTAPTIPSVRHAVSRVAGSDRRASTTR